MKPRRSRRRRALVRLRRLRTPALLLLPVMTVLLLCLGGLARGVTRSEPAVSTPDTRTLLKLSPTPFARYRVERIYVVSTLEQGSDVLVRERWDESQRIKKGERQPYTYSVVLAGSREESDAQTKIQQEIEAPPSGDRTELVYEPAP